MLTALIPGGFLIGVWVGSWIERRRIYHRMEFIRASLYNEDQRWLVHVTKLYVLSTNIVDENYATSQVNAFMRTEGRGTELP